MDRRRFLRLPGFRRTFSEPLAEEIPHDSNYGFAVPNPEVLSNLFFHFDKEFFESVRQYRSVRLLGERNDESRDPLERPCKESSVFCQLAPPFIPK